MALKLPRGPSLWDGLIGSSFIWYVRYSLSYRDLEEMMAERRLSVDHTTIYRWVQQYAPELDKRCRPHLKATTCK